MDYLYVKQHIHVRIRTKAVIAHSFTFGSYSFGVMFPAHPRPGAQIHVLPLEDKLRRSSGTPVWPENRNECF